MARIGRFVVPDLPHHVTQRGNRRERVFFCDDDNSLYRDLFGEACRREGVTPWAYCLTPNHVHLILAPRTPEGLGRALGKAHRRYAAFVNARLRASGRLFQGRFASVVMDEEHLMAAARYVALNPVRAGLVGRAEDWPWSSAALSRGEERRTRRMKRGLCRRHRNLSGLCHRARLTRPAPRLSLHNVPYATYVCRNSSTMPSLEKL